MEYNLTDDVTVSGGLIGAVGEQVCYHFSSLALQFTAPAALFQIEKLTKLCIEGKQISVSKGGRLFLLLSIKSIDTRKKYSAFLKV